MFGNEPERGPPTSLRGWLSDVYFPAILDGALGPLSIRLGPRATVDDPLFGRTTGLPALDGMLTQVREWLTKNAAEYTRGQFTTGIDRDVTEGQLALHLDGRDVKLPVAVVAERRRSREVELRIYYATRPILRALTHTGTRREVELRIYYATRPFSGKAATRASLLATKGDVVLPKLVSDHVDAMRKGNVDQVLACFDADAALVDPTGIVHESAGGGLRTYLEKVLGPSSSCGWDLQGGGAADDGRTCALEYSMTKIAGRDIPPQAGLMVYTKGDSGLLRSIRIYDDIDV